ncbi:phage tail protein [Desulfocurvus sp. DL9XJH121]
MITETTPRTSYPGNGATTEFPISWPWGGEEEVKAKITGGAEDVALVPDTDFSLTGGDGASGTLTLAGDPLEEGLNLVIWRETALSQTRNWGGLSSVDPTKVGEGHDKLTRIAQDISMRLGDVEEGVEDLDSAVSEAEAAQVAAEAAAVGLAAAVLAAQEAQEAAEAAAAAVALPATGAANAFLTVNGDGDGLEYAGGAAARAKLGLGTAAVADTGVAAGNVPVLDAGGLLDPGLVADMQGDAGAGGARGLVPAPAAGDAGKALLGSGAWGVMPSVPSGCVAWFGAHSPPEGWLECDGAAVSRTTYADLFAAIGEIHGSGDGSTTFNLPDQRGQFVRGWDNGAGVDSGRALGSSQSDQNLSHAHTCTNVSAGTIIGNQYGGTPGYYTVSVSSGATGSSGGTEARPKNVALMAIIKY